MAWPTRYKAKQLAEQDRNCGHFLGKREDPAIQKPFKQQVLYVSQHASSAHQTWHDDGTSATTVNTTPEALLKETRTAREVARFDVNGL